LHHDGTGYILTPWNLFLYNSNSTNLANHGLHPRVTHAAVNMPMLLTAAFPLLYRTVLAVAVNFARGRLSWLRIDVLLASTIVVGIMALSLFPHQEPRFLLPLLVPAFALLSTTSWLSSSRMQLIWVISNVVLVLFWGGLHQGALLPALYSLSSEAGACSVAVAGTYSAPATAVASCTAVGKCSSVPVSSLEGASVSEIDLFMQKSLQRQCVFLVAPSSHPLSVGLLWPPFLSPHPPLVSQVDWLVGCSQQHLPSACDDMVASHLH
jgi:phosphatidylinositol glycan class Z